MGGWAGGGVGGSYPQLKPSSFCTATTAACCSSESGGREDRCPKSKGGGEGGRGACRHVGPLTLALTHASMHGVCAYTCALPRLLPFVDAGEVEGWQEVHVCEAGRGQPTQVLDPIRVLEGKWEGGECEEPPLLHFAPRDIVSEVDSSHINPRFLQACLETEGAWRPTRLPQAREKESFDFGSIGSVMHHWFQS